ncbi:MAG: DUF1573 domain-containing protein [Gemmataceae bacterium]|nr:DUF1573 domain-containing protein [Gemmataceae bacterium]
MHKALSALIAILLTATTANAQQSGWAEKLFGGELTHDFGAVPRGTQMKHSFKITNIYKVQLQITEVRVSCGCLKAELSTKVLNPGDTAMLHLNMDGRQFNGFKTIRVFVTVGPKFISTAVLSVSAVTRGDVAFSPSEIDFGNLNRGQMLARHIDVEYAGDRADWRVIEILKNSSAPFELRVEDLPRLVGSSPRRGYRILATMRAEAAVGNFKQEVVLKTNDSATPMLTFQVVGNVQAGLAISPGSIAVRDMKAGETVTKKVFVRASKAFRIIGVDGQGDGITVDIPNRQDTTLVLTVNIQPTAIGDIRKQLLIRTDLDAETTPLIVEVSVSP